MNTLDQLRAIRVEMMFSDESWIERLSDELEAVIVSIEVEEREREKAAVKETKKRYTSYGERYDWGEGRWYTVEEEVTRMPAKEAEQEDPDEGLEQEINILETIVGDLRRENLRLQSELDSRRGP